MNLTESHTKESFVIETFSNGEWEPFAGYDNRSSAEACLAELVESEQKWTQARIIRKIVKTTTNKWLVKQIEL
jgi:hypothetical protein